MIVERRKEGETEWSVYRPGLKLGTLEPGYEYRAAQIAEPAAPKWPQTMMTEEQLAAQVSYVIQPYPGQHAGPFYTSVANAVLAHACETGALVPADKVREIEAKAREEGIKEGRSKEQALRQVEVDFGYCNNRVGYQCGQAFSQSQMEIHRQQHADAVKRGLRK